MSEPIEGDGSTGLAPAGHTADGVALIVGGRDPDVFARALREHKRAFARALDYQDAELLLIARERLEESRRITASLESCTTWAELMEVKEAWAVQTSEACQVEARRLAIYADLIRHPDWLRRQVQAGLGSTPRLRVG